MTATTIRCSSPPATDGAVFRPHAVIRGAIRTQQIHGKSGWIEVASSVCWRMYSLSLVAMVPPIDGDNDDRTRLSNGLLAPAGPHGFKKKWIQDTIII
jgi:hypothetical protein